MLTFKSSCLRVYLETIFQFECEAGCYYRTTVTPSVIPPQHHKCKYVSKKATSFWNWRAVLTLWSLTHHFYPGRCDFTPLNYSSCMVSLLLWVQPFSVDTVDPCLTAEHRALGVSQHLNFLTSDQLKCTLTEVAVRTSPVTLCKDTEAS